MEYGEKLRAVLPAGGSGGQLYVYASLGSTNTRAGELAQGGAPEGTLVVADQQTGGRGRRGAKWHTPPGKAIAMSLVLRPPVAGLEWTGLGSVALVEALAAFGVEARIKWPNDVLASDRKVAGILAEAAWDGARLDHVILGIGVNVGRGAAPDASQVDYPATDLESATGNAIDRVLLLAEVVRSIDRWRPKVPSPAFLRAWDRALAFKGEWIELNTDAGTIQGTLTGLGPEGEAVIEQEDGASLVLGSAAWGLRRHAQPGGPGRRVRGHSTEPGDQRSG